MKAAEVTDKHDFHGVQPVLFVSDVRRTLDYYRDMLGFHIDFEAGEPLLHAVSRLEIASTPAPLESGSRQRRHPRRWCQAATYTCTSAPNH